VKIAAFQGLRPKVDLASQVASVPYDTVNVEEARSLAQGNPNSFLRVSRAEIELPVGTDPYTEAVYSRAAANLKKFCEQGILVREEGLCLYAYRQIMGEHAQTAIVACCHIEDYEHNVIRKHETTRADKEQDRIRLARALRVNTGPVFLMYRDQPAIDREVSAGVSAPPLFDFRASDGIQHTLWRIPGGEKLVRLFGQVPLAYIADGHHRAAAACKTGVEMRQATPNHTGQEAYNWFMAALFPASQLRILPYNRCVRDLRGLSPDSFLQAVKNVFTVTHPVSPTPAGTRQVSMYLGRQWYGLTWTVPPQAGPIASLDVSVLQDRLLHPLLGIENPRTDKRIDFVGGIRGPDELVRLVDSGQFAVAFSMYPVTVDQVMAVADAGEIMPPKSTWFEPKLRSGLFIHTW
jgi:uncharacterized protein (DUF1015 family)